VKKSKLAPFKKRCSRFLAKKRPILEILVCEEYRGFAAVKEIIPASAYPKR
jgi:hypothetical protein